ncbi:MAG: hypothetical protein JSU92_09015, partial [Deltaproteobacteria bacterium]
SGVYEITVEVGPYSVTGTSFPIALVIPADGEYTVTARVEDNCGNIGQDTVTNVWIDTINPVVGISSPTSGKCIDSSTVVVNGSVTESGSGVYEITVEVGPYSVTGTSFPIALVIPADGEYTITALVEDDCGNVGQDTVANVRVDTTAPEVSISSPSAGECINSSTVVVEGSITESGSGVRVITVEAGAYSVTSTTFPITLNMPTPADGVYTVTARVEDNCGNIGSDTAADVRIDTVIPEVSISSPSSGTTLYSSTVIITGRASDDIEVAEVVVGLDGPSIKSRTVSVVAGGWTAVFNGVLKGGYTAVAVATDACNNDSDPVGVVFGVTYPVGLPDTIQISADNPAVVISMATVILKDVNDFGVPGQETSILVTSDRNPPVEVFSDDFESGGLGGWTSVGSISVEGRTNDLDPLSTQNAYFLSTAEIWRVIDTTGYGNVQVSYQFATHGLDTDENFIFEISVDGGGAWTVVEAFGADVGESGWQQRNFNISMLYPFLGVEDNPQFAIRFRQNANSFLDASDLDNVGVNAVSVDIVRYSSYAGEGRYIFEVSTCTLGPTTLCASWAGVPPLFTDGLSGNSGCAQVNFVAPTVQIVSPTNGAVLNAYADKDLDPVNGLQYDVTVSTDAPDGSTVLLTVDGYTPLGASVVGGSVTFSGVDFPEGLAVDVEAVVGVCSGPVTVVHTVTVDTFIPVVGISSPTPGDCINSSKVVVDGTVTELGCGVKVITVQAGAYTATSATFPIILTIPVDGVYAIDAWAEDNCGNTGPVDTVVNVRVDTTDPLVSIGSPTPGKCINSSAVEVNGSVVEAGSGVRVITVQAGAYTATSATFPIILTIPVDGEYTINAWVEDNCGNVGPVDTVANVWVDTTEPLVSIVSPTPDECIDNSVVVVDGNVVEDGSGVSVITVEAGAYSATGGSFPITLIIPVDGVYTITAWAEDSCRNVGPKNAVANVQVDTIDPLVDINSPVSGEYIGTSTVLVDGTVTESGSGVRVITVQAGAYSATSATFPISLNIPVDGLYDITAWVEDSCGNIGPVDTVANVQVDTAAPVVTIELPTSGSTHNQATVVVEGSVSDSEPSSGLMWVLVNGQTALGTEDWMIILSGLAEGENTLVATVRDWAGNEGSDTVVIFVDTIAPQVSISSPGPGDFIDSTTVIVTGNVTDASPSSGITEIWVNSVTATITGNSWTATLIALPQGSVTIDVRVYDGAGNEGVAAVNITVDTIAPTVSITLPTSASTLNQATIVVEGSATDTPPSSRLNRVVVNGQTASGTYDWMVTISGLAEGWNSLTATVWDNAGNYSSDSVSIFVDTVAPVVSITSPNKGDCINTTAVNVTGTITETGSGVGLITAMAVGPEVFSATGTSFPVSMTVSVDGLYSISVQVTDKAGNSSPVVWVNKVRVDTVAPVVSINSPVTGECFVTSSVVVDGSAVEDGSKVYEITVQAGAFTATGDSFPITLNILADGVYTITARVEDNCGNVGLDTVTDVEIDTALPVVSINSPADGECIVTSTVSVNATSDGGEAVTCTLDGLSPIVAPDSWTLVSEGSHTIECTSTDDCGNNSLPVSVTVTVDTVLPVVSINSPADGECIITSTVAVDASSDGGELVSCTIDGASSIAVPGSWTSVGEGSHTVECTSTDACGNDSLPVSITVTVDTVAPLVSISSPGSGDCIDSSTVVVDGSVTEAGSGVKEITVEAGAYSATGASFPITLVIPADGVYTVTAWVEDNCGNISSEATVANIKVDTVEPVVAVSYPAPGDIVSTDQVIVTGTVTDASPSSGITDVWVNGVSASITGTNWSATLTALPEGSVTIDVRAYDCAGNEGVAVPVNITVDTVLPTVSITLPTSGTTINQSTVVVEGTANDAPPSSGLKRVVVNGKTASGTESWMVSISSLSEGINTLTATVWDNADNSFFDSVSVFVDTIAPVVSVSSPVSGDCINSVTVAVTGAITEDGSEVELITVMAVGPEVFSATSSGFPVNLTVSIDGLYSISVQVSDKAGNSSPVVWVNNVRVDTVVPVASISSPVVGECIETSAVVVNGSVVEGGSGVSVITVEAGAFTATGSSFPITLNIPADGVYTISVWAEDSCGNVGPKDTVANVTVDTTAPVVLSISSPSVGECIATSAVVVGGSVTDFGGSGVKEIRVGAGVYKTTGSSFPVTLVIPADGVYTITVRAEDYCGEIGNVGPATMIANVRVDTLAPVVDITLPVMGEYIASSTVTVEGSVVEAGSGIEEITVQVGAYTATGSSFPIALVIPDGVYTITAWAEDSCGNIGPKDEVANVTVDTTTLSVSITSPSAGECVNSATVVVSGDVSDPAPSSGIAGVTVNGVDADVTGLTWTATLTGQAEGALTLVATATDLAGNSTDSAPVIISIDYSLPAVSIIAPDDGAYLNTTTVVVNGTAGDGSGSVAAVLVNGYAATGTNNWSITLGSSQYGYPVEVSSRDTADRAYGVFVSGDYAYVADWLGGLAIIDVSDPANPGIPVYRDTLDRSRRVYVAGNYAYVADGSSGLAIINVSDPVNPGAPVYRDTTGYSNGIYVIGGYAYVADFTSGLAIIDVSDPANPGTPVYRDTSGQSYGVYVTGNYAYVADFTSGLAIIDVTDPTSPGTPIYRDTVGDSYGVQVADGYAYIADWNGLAVIDVSDPANPGTPVYRDTTGWAHGVYVANEYAYVADDGSGLAVIDVTDPTNPETPVYHDTPGDSRGIYVTGGYAYVADYWEGLRVIDVSGSSVFSAVAIDNCGNASLPDTVGVTIDTIAPTVTITLPVSGATLNQTTVEVRGTVSDTLPSSGIDYIVVNGQTASGTDPWIVTVTSLTQGVNTLTAIVRDNAGNEGTTSIPVFVDTVAPAAPVITSPASGPTSDNTPRVAGTAEAGTTVEILEGVFSWGTTVADGGGNFALVLPALVDGAHTLVATATDGLGNTSGISNTVVIFVDTREPDVLISSPNPGDIYSVNWTVVTGTVTDDEPSSGITGVWVNGTSADVVGSSWTVTLMGLSEGSVTIDAIAYDGAGNEGVSVPVNITVDTIAPTVSITLPISGTTINQTTVVVEGSANDAPPSSGLKRVIVNGKTASGTESWIVTLGGLAEGWNSITATVWDNADNYSSDSVSVFVDTTAPVVSVSSPTVGECINTETVVVTGAITETGSGVELITAMAVGPEVFSATGTGFPVNLTVSVDGLYSISVQVSDKVGNISPVVWVNNVRVDTVAPVASISAPVTGECIATSAVVVNGSVVEGGSGVSMITVEAGAFTATGSSFPITLDIPADGVYTVTVWAEDSCGNVGPKDTVANVTVDTTAPVVLSISSPVAGECIGTSAVVVGGSVTDFGGSGVKEIRVGAGSYKTTGSSFPVTLVIPADGVYTITVRAEDYCGEIGNV